jgi:peptidoglycan/xylan/chitin deacetylase (PgdA/CDA1 family)
MSVLLAVLLAFPVVVMYHRIDVWAPSDPVSQRLTISPAQFTDELRSLHRNGLHTVGIAELVRDLSAHQPPQHAVLLTFDDGYRDQFTYAFPILQRFGDRATFFVNVGTIGKPGHLSWNDLETMAKAGMSIECHGIDHVDLAALGRAAQSYQIEQCVRMLSAHLQNPVLAYAYPSGAFDSQTIEVERRAGLLLGFTTDPRFQSDAQSPYELTRIRVVSGISDARFTALLESTRSYVKFETSGSPAGAPRRT